MKLLITGATGLIGQAVIAKLMNSQNSLIALTRDVVASRPKLPASVQLVAQLSEVDFNQLDVVLNLAGEPIANTRWSSTQKQKICQSRWQLTEQIASHINSAQHPPHTFISGSAIGYYGRQGPQPIDEEYQACYPEFSHQLCKRWESLALAAQSDKTRVCLLRTGIVLANNQGALAKMLPAFKFGLGGPIGDGQQMMSWIHLADMVRVILACINNKALIGAINATAPQPVSNYDFSHGLCQVLHRPCILTTPAWLVKLLFGELSDLLLYGQNVIPNKLQQQDFSFEFPTLTAALTDLLR
jgi:uncharacterized protein